MSLQPASDVGLPRLFIFTIGGGSREPAIFIRSLPASRVASVTAFTRYACIHAGQPRFIYIEPLPKCSMRISISARTLRGANSPGGRTTYIPTWGGG